MMVVRSLIHPETGSVSATLTPGKKIVVYEGRIVEKLKTSGILVTLNFKNKFNTKWRVYKEDPENFARAFEECYFKKGLQQQGYQWKEGDPSTWPSDKELISALYKEKPSND